MKNNQRSIDGFTPRRPIQNKIEKNKEDKKVDPTENKKINFLKEQKKDNSRDLELALERIDIEEHYQEQEDNNKKNKKEQKLARKLDKVNRKRLKKGKKPLDIKALKKRIIIKRILRTIIFIIILICGIYGYRAVKSLSNFAFQNGGNIFDVLKKEELKKDKYGRTNILIFGTSPDGWDGADLTDSIMVASLNQENKKIYTVSLPRDLWVKHTCSSWLGTNAGKLNETYACAKSEAKASKSNNIDAEKRGQKALSDKVGEILGLDIQYQVHGNWQVLIDSINAIGGIDVKVEVWDGSPEMYDYATKVRYKNGQIAHMDGEKALAFSRARGSHGGYGFSGGNFDRERNQQKILQATVAKINQQKMNPDALIRMAETLGNNIHHSFDTKEIRTVAELAGQLSGSNTQSLPLAGKSTNYFTTGNVGKASVVLPVAGTFDYTDIQEYINKNTKSSSILDEKAKVVVLNGTDTSGLAAKVKKDLVKDDFNIVEIGTADKSNYSSSKIYKVSDVKMEKTIKALADKFSSKAEEGDSSIKNKYSEIADIVVVVGNNYESN